MWKPTTITDWAALVFIVSTCAIAFGYMVWHVFLEDYYNALRKRWNPPRRSSRTMFKVLHVLFRIGIVLAVAAILDMIVASTGFIGVLPHTGSGVFVGWNGVLYDYDIMVMVGGIALFMPYVFVVISGKYDPRRGS